MSKSSYTLRRKAFITQEESSEPLKLKNSPEKLSPIHELSLLKKKHDFLKQENIKKTQYLDWLSSKLSELKSTANSIESDINLEKNRYQELTEEIQKASQSLNQELEMRKIYEHMLNRNKSEGTNLDKKVIKFNEDLKIAKLKMDFENDKARKIKENKYLVKNMFKDLKINLEEDAKKIISHINTLENNILTRKDLIKRFDERNKRQAEIIEIAAKNDREVHEKSLREKIVMNKMLLDLLIIQENKVKNEGKEIENAFLDIRTKTALTDPKEILEKFMTREETNAKLINSVEKAEKTLEKLKKDYHNFKSQLKNILLLNDAENRKKIEEKNTLIEKGMKNYEKEKIVNRKISIVFKEIVKWGEKTCKKLEIGPQNNFNSSVQVISEKISNLIQKAMENKEKFEENITKYNLKKTSEILKEIYKEPLSPLKSQMV